MAFATYYIIDDTAVGTTFGTGAGSGQQLSPDFQAGSPADAATVAAQYAQLFNRTVRLVAKGGTPPWTPTYAPTSCRVFPSAVPPSITF